MDRLSEIILRLAATGAELSKDKPNKSDLATIVRVLAGTDRDKKIKDCNEFYKYIHELRVSGFPEYLGVDYRSKIKDDLRNDKKFWKRAGIPYTDIDEHFVDIDLAYAVFYSIRIRDIMGSFTE